MTVSLYITPWHLTCICTFTTADFLHNGLKAASNIQGNRKFNEQFVHGVPLVGNANY